MKFLGLIALICVVLGIVACGDDSSSAEAEKPEKLTKPEIDPPRAPPEEVVIEDLIEGSGEEAEVGDTITIHYRAVGQDGKELFSSWGNGFGPDTVELGVGEYFPALEEGIEGMKVGGRREILIPSDLAFKHGPLYYAIDLRQLGKAP